MSDIFTNPIVSKTDTSGGSLISTSELVTTGSNEIVSGSMSVDSGSTS